MIRKDKHVVKHFDRAAGTYDRSITVRHYQSRTLTLILERMPIKSGMRVLELGCGTGTGTLAVAARLNGTGKVTGLDVSPKMLEQARMKLSQTGPSNVKFLLASAHDLDYHTTFDVVFSTNSFHHFSDKDDIFRRVWRALKPNGCFLVQDFCSDFLLMQTVDLLGKLGERAHVGTTTSRQLQRLYRNSGFAEVEVTALKLNRFWGIMIGRGIKPESAFEPEDRKEEQWSDHG